MLNIVNKVISRDTRLIGKQYNCFLMWQLSYLQDHTPPSHSRDSDASAPNRKGAHCLQNYIWDYYSRGAVRKLQITHSLGLVYKFLDWEIKLLQFMPTHNAYKKQKIWLQPHRASWKAQALYIRVWISELCHQNPSQKEIFQR